MESVSESVKDLADRDGHIFWVEAERAMAYVLDI